MSRYAVDTVALQDRADLVRIFVFKIRLLADHLPDQILLKWCKIGNSPAHNPVEGQGNQCGGMPVGERQKAYPPGSGSRHTHANKNQMQRMAHMPYHPPAFLDGAFLLGSLDGLGSSIFSGSPSCSDAPASPVSSTV